MKAKNRRIFVVVQRSGGTPEPNLHHGVLKFNLDKVTAPFAWRFAREHAGQRSTSSGVLGAVVLTVVRSRRPWGPVRFCATLMIVGCSMGEKGVGTALCKCSYDQGM